MCEKCGAFNAFDASEAAVVCMEEVQFYSISLANALLITNACLRT